MDISIVGRDQEFADRLRREVERIGNGTVTSCSPGDLANTVVSSELLLVHVPDDPDLARGLVEEARRSSEARVVAVGTATNPAQIIACVQAGASDYVNGDAPLGSQLEVVLGRLKSEPTSRLGRLVAVTSGSGGSGSSSVAVNLAVSLASTERPCGLVDLDLRRGNLGAMLDLKPRHTLAELWADGTRLDTGMVEQSLAGHESGVRLLAAPRRIVDLRADAETVGRTVDLVRGFVPHVVADVDLEPSGATFSVLAASDPIVFVVQLDFVGVSRARRWLDHLEEIGIERSRILFVVNRHARPGDLPIPKVERVLGGEIGLRLPNDPKVLVRSVNTGRPAVLDAPRSRYSTAIGELTQRISAIIETGVARPSTQHRAESVDSKRVDRPRLFDQLARTVASITPFNV